MGTSLRAATETSLKRLFAACGLSVTRREKFGIDQSHDITRLAHAWDYPLRTYFDVGANEGGTARKALVDFSHAEVFSFEPHPATFQRLIANLSNHERFHAFNVALSDQCTDADLFQYGNSYVNSLVTNAQYALRSGEAPKRLTVRCTTLDQFCTAQKINTIDVLKIDTEGFDMVVLAGAKQMLERRAVRFVYVEFNDLRPKEGAFGGGLMPIDDLLRPMGFRFVAVYNDYIETSGELFGCSNALFALPPNIH